MKAISRRAKYMGTVLTNGLINLNIQAIGS